MERKNLQDALLKSANGLTNEEAAIVVEPERQEVPEPRPVRAKVAKTGKVNVTGYFDPEVKSSLRLIQAKTGKTIQDILAEALNDVFAKYKVPETAPRN
ncbi:MULTISPECIES: ribbon-helix-helix domain-containing protein [unclassified Nitrospina]|uniref:ribbon-helix-helix domain-containing protein n=1 Tax=unclassified Nitrospina TaxID=2638683 RepID=UPI003F9E7871